MRESRPPGRYLAAMPLDTFFLYVATWVLVAISPGPAVMFAMSQAARHGMQGAIAGTGGILLITVSGDTSVTLTRTGGGAPAMTASLVRAATTSGGGIALLGGTLLPSGVQTYYVGGTLNVGANQPAGDYSGTFQLTVNYL